MWNSFVSLIQNGLLLFNNIIDSVGIPYSFGFAIILFTIVVKTLTYPLNVKQMKSAKATQELQPQIKELQKKYGDNREKLAQAQMGLYKEAGVNPLGGCLPMLVQMPIWIGLYRALFNLAAENAQELEEGFFWIPSLTGPVKDVGMVGGEISWLWPIGGPDFLGWGEVMGYLILPVLLVVSQLAYQKMITPSSDDPQQKMMAQMMMFMPFMFGYFSLIVPAGLTLYWFTNNILSMAQQYFINQMKVTVTEVVQKDTNSQTSTHKEDQPISEVPEATITPATINTKNGVEKNGRVQSNGRPKPKSKSRSRSKSKRKRKKSR